MYIIFFRSFQDAQLRLISEIMEQIYNMGSVVNSCEIMLEFERSGRDPHGVVPTSKCNLTEVKVISQK